MIIFFLWGWDLNLEGQELQFVGPFTQNLQLNPPGTKVPNGIASRFIKAHNVKAQ